MMKSRKFFVHFNQINMKRGLRTVWTIHTSKACIPATRVEIQVPISTRYRPEGAQPRAVLRGEGVILPIPGEKDAYSIVSLQVARGLEVAEEDAL